MTFVTMRWVQQNALDVFKAPKTVLAFMAMKAHFDDGTAAWPAMDTIAVECGLSVRTVQRAIMQLVDMGYLELGQQDFSRVDPRTGRQVRNDRRTTVWNVICKTPRLELEAETVEEPNGDGMAACVRYARRASTKGPGSERSGKAEPVCENVTPCGTEMSPRDEAPGNERGDISARNPAKMSPNIQEIHINPSAPTGHLPASGANPGEDTKPKPDDSPGPTRLEAERWLGAETAPVARDDSPLTPSDEEDLVCRALERGWSLDPAMPIPRPVSRRHRRELAAARRLIDHCGLEAATKVALWAASPTAPGAAAASSGGKPYDGFWRRTLTGVRALESHWDQVIAQMADDRSGRRTLEHVTRIRFGATGLARPAKPSQPAGPNPPRTRSTAPDPAENGLRPPSLRDELAEYAAAHGSTSCFAGNWPGRGGGL